MAPWAGDRRLTLVGETIAEIAAAILATAPSRFALAGISMGGYISFEIIRQAPQRVLKLPSLDTSARPDTPEQIAQRLSLIERARADNFEALAVPLMGGLTHPSRRDDPALREINLRVIRAIGFDGFERQTRAIVARVDLRPKPRRHFRSDARAGRRQRSAYPTGMF